MNTNTLIINLLDDYPTESVKIHQIKTLIEEIDKGNNVQINLELLQQINNGLYDISLTDDVIELQVIINEYRNKYDLTDPREVENIDDTGKFVQ